MPAQENKPVTLVIGASTNPQRYSYIAAGMLRQYGHAVQLLGLREGVAHNLPIETDKTPRTGIDTITLYVGPQNQETWWSTILDTRPRRLILNPGTENPTLAAAAVAAGIEVEEACTLVLLSSGQY